MAKPQQQNVSGSVMGADDGFLFIRGLEDNSLQRYLDEYQARIVGYQQIPGEMFTNVTMKIAFPETVSDNNASLWAFFMVKAAHPSAQKPRIKIVSDGAWVFAYVTWPIWNSVKHVESKKSNQKYDF